MSLDVSLADPISTLSPWQQMKARLFAEREIAADALRRELASQPIVERTPELVQADIDRYTAQLKVEPVIHCLPWLYDVQAKLDAAKAELATLTGGAR